MAIFSLLFGHPDWPAEKPPRAPVATPDLSASEREERLVTVPDGHKRVDASAALESSLRHRMIEVSR
jgi:hypothetical protein